MVYRRFARIYSIAGIIEFMVLWEEGGNETSFREASIDTVHSIARLLSTIKISMDNNS